MRKFLQDYGKQVLAVVSVLLMIAFFLPAGFKRMGSSDNPVIGKLGSDKLYSRDAYNGKQAFEMLQKQRVDFMGRSLADLMLGPIAVSQISAHPDLFALLVKEAQRMGVTVSKDRVNEIIQNYLPPQAQQDEDRLDALRFALEQGMLVQNAFERAASVVKVSQPLRQHELARQAQAISVNLVEYDAAKYSAKIQPPTTQQIQEQFTKFRDNLRGNANPTTNPFGFGYKYPDRMKLQYVAVPRMEVRRAVEASQEPRRWDIDAYKHYTQNQHLYPTTQQAAPATQKAFSLESTRPASTTRPFPEVQSEIRNQLISSKTDQLQAAIFEKIQTTLASDYMAYRAAPRAAGATQPTTVPASSLKAPYNSFDYLQALANQIQQLYKVRPTVVSLHDRYITPEEILRVPGLGEVRIGQENLSAYLGSSVAVFNAAVAPGSEANLLHLYQPSPPLADALGNVYMLRVTDAQRARAPDAIVEVLDQVRQDLLTAQAYALAKADAQKLLNTSKVGGLRSAAQASGLSVITTGTFLNRPTEPIAGYALSGPAKTQFLNEAYKLLSTSPAHPGAQPIRLIELPQIAKLDVAELASVSPMWSADRAHLAAEDAANAAASEQIAQFMRDWFDYNAVVARLDYKPTEGMQEHEPQPPAPAQPPIF